METLNELVRLFIELPLLGKAIVCIAFLFVFALLIDLIFPRRRG